jgi:hypothetical protein
VEPLRSYDMRMDRRAQGARRLSALARPVLVAPALILIGLLLVGFGGDGLARIETLGQVTSGPAGPIASSDSLDGGRDPSADRIETQVLAPAIGGAEAQRGSSGPQGNRAGGSENGARSGSSASSSDSQASGPSSAPTEATPDSGAPDGGGASPSAPAGGAGGTGGAGAGGVTDSLPEPVKPIAEDTLDRLLDGSKGSGPRIDVPDLKP